jgi:aspartate/tyrosine/aromatic aminotransferase
MVKQMSAEADIQEIKQTLLELSSKFNELLEEKETFSMMRLSEKGLKFISKEPDIYSIKDLRVRYK